MKALQPTKNGSKTRETNVLLNTLVAFKRGNFSVRMPVHEVGVPGKIADTLNEILELNQKMVSEFARISKAVGKDASSGLTSKRLRASRTSSIEAIFFRLMLTHSR